ncbi:transmembrane protein, putative (macronuclear) [Tetrahymena thermophila SB210]|uniref:Transmembrane protein, putative n=1 Tax=Tetrahymena thermophila (strain SB210) TaxID=312017 RepID=I7MGA8_TETTS|nr:transmembrane protein, putative [Tetrahymena thermophila SB210]EAS01290.1 transmembrane protein, putative [Tetrahymena thermophila SB210]|eukprot:XP_001021535.1 transmembrane protein, putative [Tetrahymena thermophila SB210]
MSSEQNKDKSGNSLKSDTMISNLIDVEEIYKSQKLYKATPKLETKPIHLKPLELQQKSLFEAFFKGDQKYIYEFDKETLLYREKYIRKLSQQGLTVCLYTGGINWFVYQFVFKSSQHSIATKISSFTILNAIPLSYFAYKILVDYNKANEFLFERYLKQ